MRKQGREGWLYLPSSGSDSPSQLQGHAHYPNELLLTLRRPAPTYVRLAFDKNFEAAEGKNVLSHNNKDYLQPTTRKMLYEKYISMSGGPAPKGARQTYKVRLQFETR